MKKLINYTINKVKKQIKLIYYKSNYQNQKKRKKAVVK